ncbi:MAG: glycosyl hydrolase [Luteolibacter sp.]
MAASFFFDPSTRSRWLAAVLFSGLGICARAEDFPKDPLGWPAVTSTNKPWTRWWWLGSAVDKKNLTSELENFAKTGLGGVEICPIYGAVGAEDRFLKFLSPEWMAMLGHTTSEAKRLGMGVDMTTGTGWPFGGPQVTPGMASEAIQVQQWEANGGQMASLTLPEGNLLCLRAFPESGPPVDIPLGIKQGKVEWMPGAGKWTIVALSVSTPIQKVKRAAPGGEGNVLDPFSGAAMSRYLETFDKAFDGFNAPTPRAQFHDSFEYYGANWTSEFFDQFKASRGYDFRDQLAAFVGKADSDTVDRVRADYKETLSDLHLGYLTSWHDWAKAHGSVTRNQAHGSPGNLLDHYAVSEIPETEIFKDVDESQIPMLRFPASAAHANGTPLVSSETFTWLDEHFKVTPDKLKQAADFVFLGGVNHVFFHGIPYSPADVPWPGWLFYASTNMGPNDGLWHDLPAFTGYLQRCQSILQDGYPSSDVLLYYPIYDLWQTGTEKPALFTVHDQDKWLWPTTFYKTTMDLWNHGITFDYASDRMLAKATVRDGKIILGDNAFSALVLPGVNRLRPETLKRILELTAQGATLIVQDGWPHEVPGFYQHKERREALLDQEKTTENIIACSGSILPTLAERGIDQEHMTDSGLRFVRRTHKDGYHYFIANRSKQAFDGPLPIAVPFESALLLDPWTSKTGIVSPGFPLHLDPGQSILIRTFTHRKIAGKPWPTNPPNPQSIAINGPWKIEFIEGGPILPKSAEVTTLGSWTSLPDPDVKNFSGTASYTTSFDFPGPENSSTRLDLGHVAETARVFVNGQPAGISWCSPHIIDLTGFLKTGKNDLRIEVTNLAANRVADLDRRKVNWKQFHEINFVNIDYKPFDASAWPALDSGLRGPVRLLIPPK